MLGLKRPASARFWRLKAQELLNAEATAKKDEKEREARLAEAFEELQREGKRISGRALAERAKANRTAATEWLQLNHPELMNTGNAGTGATAESQPSGATSVDDESQNELDSEPLTGTNDHRFRVIK